MNESTINLVNINGSIVVEHRSVHPTIDHLPGAIYTITLHGDPMAPKLAFKKERDRFTIPEKLYGKNTRYYDAIMSSYRKRPGATGAFLVGRAGSGKSVLTEQLANNFVSADRPVFWIKESSVPVAMIRSAIAIAGPNGCMVIFDELSKMYPEHNTSETNGPTQDSLLTLLSDSELKKVLFVATDNSTGDVNTYLDDRPGRFLYWIEFFGLNVDDVVEYCTDKKVSKEMISEISYYANRVSISYDILQTLVDVALDAEDVTDFKFKLDILNVPLLTWSEYSLVSIIDNTDADIVIASATMTVSDLENIEIELPSQVFITVPNATLPKTTAHSFSVRYGKYDIKFDIKMVNKKPNDIYHSTYNAESFTPVNSNRINPEANWGGLNFKVHGSAKQYVK